MHIARRITPGFLYSWQARPRCFPSDSGYDNSSWPPRAAVWEAVWVSEETSAADKLSQGLQRLTGAAKGPAIHNCATLALTSMPGGWLGCSGGAHLSNQV